MVKIVIQEEGPVHTTENLMMYLHESHELVDLKVNKALVRAKRAIMTRDKDELIVRANINAAGQIAIAADVLSEQIFLNTLVDEGITGTLYSEESGVKHFGEPQEDDPLSLNLLLDPLDGSQNYMKGLPFGCISVAYGGWVEDPQLSDLSKASIMNLYSDETFFVDEHNNAYLNDMKLVPTSERHEPHFSERTIQISYYAYGNKASRYFFDFQEQYSLRSLGSAAWELAIIAANRNDAFADIRGVLKTHDFAGAKILLEALGSKIRFLNYDDGEIDALPLDDFTSGYALVASGDAELLEHLLADFRRHDLL